MITTILMCAGLGFLHLIIGVVIAKWSTKVWKEGKENIQSFILFPFNTMLENIGNGYSILTFITEVNEDVYNKWMAFMWSAKLAWNIGVMLPIGGLAYGIVKTCALLVGLAGRVAGIAAKPVEAFETLKEKQRLKRLEKAKQLKLSPVDPMLDGYNRNDIETQMEEQRRIIDAGTKEYQKLKKIHESIWHRLMA